MIKRDTGYYWIKKFNDSKWEILWYDSKIMSWYNDKDFICFDDDCYFYEIDEQKIIQAGKKEMDIKELKINKKKLEDKIKQLTIDFQEKTGIIISNINIYSIVESKIGTDNQTTLVQHIDIDITI